MLYTVPLRVAVAEATLWGGICLRGSGWVLKSGRSSDRPGGGAWQGGTLQVERWGKEG